MNHSLARRVSLSSLLSFTAPTIIMMVFMSMYSMVDGAFVSRFVGTAALSSVNIVYPLMSIMLAVGIMLGTGGSAVVAKQMGEGKPDDARRSFSLIAVTGLCISVVIMVVGFVFTEPLVYLLGSNDATHNYCVQYMSWLLVFTPAIVMQSLFQAFFVTAGKPMLGLAVTVAGGIANILLDYLFIVPLGMGVGGAAAATGIGSAIPAMFGLVYFAVARKGSLCFVRPAASGRVIVESCANGSSEMVTNLATAVTTYLFNVIMMGLMGEDGVAAITIVLYTQFVLTAVYLGYSMGVAPIISYNHGEGNVEQLQRIFRISIKFIGVVSLITFAIAMGAAEYLVMIFAHRGTAVFDIAHGGFLLFSVSYLFMGGNIFASSMFTAFGDGKVSAIISFLRTFVFLVLLVLLLPKVLDLTGVWLAVPLAELLTLSMSIFYFVRLRHRYRYA